MPLPGPLRAAVGLLATAADEAKHLPDRAIELPMLAVSTALQASLRVQQRYARLAARGDEVLNHREPTNEPPPWATFDEPLAADELRRVGDPAPDPAASAEAAQLLDELFGADEPEPPPPADNLPPAPKAATRKRAAPKAPRKAPVAKAAPSPEGPAKVVNKPRHAPPSRFDDVDD